MSFKPSNSRELERFVEHRPFIILDRTEIQTFVEEEGTFTSNVGTMLQELTICFIVRGENAQEQYRALWRVQG